MQSNHHQAKLLLRQLLCLQKKKRYDSEFFSRASDFSSACSMGSHSHNAVYGSLKTSAAELTVASTLIVINM